MHTFAKKPKTTQKTESTKSTKRARAFLGQSHYVSSILYLQRTIGNHDCYGPNLKKLEANTVRSTLINPALDFGQLQLHSNVYSNIQPKLKIKTPEGKYEQETRYMSWVPRTDIQIRKLSLNKLLEEIRRIKNLIILSHGPLANWMKVHPRDIPLLQKEHLLLEKEFHRRLWAWVPKSIFEIHRLSTQELIEQIKDVEHRIEFLRIGDNLPLSLLQEQRELLQEEFDRRIERIHETEGLIKLSNLFKYVKQIPLSVQSMLPKDSKLLQEEYRLLQNEYLRQNEIGRWENKSWDLATLKAIDELGFNLLATTPPADISDFCPKYPQLSKFKRKLFWIYLISCMAEKESGFKPQKQYQESFMHEGQYVISRGLLQISIASARQYGNNEIRTEADLHDPEKNIRAGIRILNYWIGRDRRIAGKSKRHGDWQGGARYWSVLRQRPGSITTEDIKKWTSNFYICK